MSPTRSLLLALFAVPLLGGPFARGSVPFIRGDVNADGAVGIDDAVFLLSHFFVYGAPTPPCLDAGDIDDGSALNIADAVALLGYLFVPGSPTPASPFPDCGTDPGNDTISCLGPIASCDFASEWVTDLAMPSPRGAHCGGVLDGRLHLFGGAASWTGGGTDGIHQIYDFDTGTWSTGAPVPDSNTWGAEGVVADDGRFYMIGGWPSGGTIARAYDPTTDTWSSLPDVPWSFEYGHVVAATPGQVHVIAGTGINHHAVYTIASGSWSFAAPPPSYSYGMAGNAIGNTIAVMVGIGGVILTYDALTDSWSAPPAAPIPAYAPATVAVDGRLTVISGTTDESGGNICTVQQFDLANETWTELTPIPTPRSWAVAVEWNDHVHVVGGFDLNNQATPVHESLPTP
ncbi:MAG: hypothetical protein KDC38_07205 [Planctomycetes bacterium]|nr:hypothetical protein [Planctomycetota bacterium]